MIACPSARPPSWSIPPSAAAVLLSLVPWPPLAARLNVASSGLTFLAAR
jgi:hypothetical protein